MNHFHEATELCDPKEVTITKSQKQLSILVIKDNVSIEEAFISFYVK